MTTHDTRQTDYYAGLIPGSTPPPDAGETRPYPVVGPAPAPQADETYVVSQQAPRLAAELLDQPPAAPKPRKPLRKRWSVRIPVLAVAGLIAIIASSSGHSHPAASVSPAPAHVTAPAHPAHKAQAHKAVKPAQAPVTTAPAAPASSAPAQPAAPAAPVVTGSQQQALTSAQGYLSDGQGFSRAGLISQLTSPYGEKFSVADATWAADHSGANWKDQAAIAAKGYASDGQGFSRQGLIDQLTSPYGGQFTYTQAVYGVGKAGL